MFILWILLGVILGIIISGVIITVLTFTDSDNLGGSLVEIRWVESGSKYLSKPEFMKKKGF